MDYQKFVPFGCSSIAMETKLPINILKIARKYLKQGKIKIIQDEHPGIAIVRSFSKEKREFQWIFGVEVTNSDDQFFYARVNKSLTHNECEVSISPTDANDTTLTTYFTSKESMVEDFRTWCELISEYDSTDSLLDDDPVIQEYAQDFYSKFQINEEDEDLQMDIEKQREVHLFLESVLRLLEENKNLENKKIIGEIQEDTRKVQTKLSIISRKEILKRVSKIVARIKKLSAKLGEHVVLRLGVELAKNLLGM
ncbi:MAG: hypothetical protein ABJG78_00400 [Cyclobacteriaceae bacterium]